MDEKHDNIDRQLTISKIDSLTIIKSGLVKRGLDLTKELKKRCVRVLIGDHSWENVGPVISNSVQNTFSEKYDLKFTWSWYCEEILEYAKKKEIEIFILFLNNLNIKNHASGFNRIKESLKLISKIRNDYKKPVIGLFSPSLDRFVEEAKLVSDFFFYAPCKLRDLNDAFEKCLEMIGVQKSQESQYLHDK